MHPQQSPGWVLLFHLKVFEWQPKIKAEFKYKIWRTDNSDNKGHVLLYTELASMVHGTADASLYM